MLGIIAQKHRTFRKRLTAYGPNVKASHQIGYLRQTLQIVRARLSGFNPDDYYILGLYDKANQKRGYISSTTFKALEARLNPRHAGPVEFNKLVMCRYFAAAGLPVPKFYGAFHRLWGFDRAGDPLRDADDLRRFLAVRDRQVVCKPISGGMGIGVVVITAFHAQTGEAMLPSGARIGFDALLRMLNGEPAGYLLQERLRAHPDIEAVYPHAVNTVRVTTLMREDGTVSVIDALLRLGCGGSATDNWSTGGLAASMSLETGVCGPAYYKVGDTAVSHHPDTGAPIAGFVVPRWREAIDLAVRAHEQTPFAGMFGWDLTIGPDGLSILETNTHCSFRLMQKTARKSLRETKLWRI